MEIRSPLAKKRQEKGSRIVLVENIKIKILKIIKKL
jgi:hypothetical protein